VYWSEKNYTIYVAGVLAALKQEFANAAHDIAIMHIACVLLRRVTRRFDR
jgi:hypothetical protein